MKRILTFTLLAWLMAAQAWAAITFDAVSTTSADASSTTHNLTIAADANIVIICSALFEGGGVVAAMTGVTVGGQAATYLTRLLGASGVTGVELWYKLGPLTGTQSIVATGDATTDKMVTGAMSFKGVAQTSTFNTPQSHQWSAEQNANLDSIASAVSEMVVTCASTFTSNTTTVSADAGTPVSTERWDVQRDAGAVSSVLGFGYTEAGAVTSINMKVDIDVAPNATEMIGVSMLPAAASTRRPIAPIIFQ